ncbi:MAG: UPF0175 family protein [Fimbriimonadales bacterium]|nr:UPF0175 family protein [Fimbriimonadales bacterium]
MRSVLSAETIAEEIDLVARAGGYANSRQLIEHALEVLMIANPALRRAAALSLYREGKVTLSRAAEIAGEDVEAIKLWLAEEGYERVLDIDPETVTRNAEQILKCGE